MVFSEIKDLSGQGMRKKELKYIKIGFLKVHIQSLKYYHEIMIKANSSYLQTAPQDVMFLEDSTEVLQCLDWHSLPLAAFVKTKI